jgi:hypothetical protein
MRTATRWLGLLLLTSPVGGQADEDPINERCPRSGKAVVADSLAEYRGYVVGFCNTHCRDDFAGNVADRPEDRGAFDAAITALPRVDVAVAVGAELERLRAEIGSPDDRRLETVQRALEREHHLLALRELRAVRQAVLAQRYRAEIAPIVGKDQAAVEELARRVLAAIEEERRAGPDAHPVPAFVRGLIDAALVRAAFYADGAPAYGRETGVSAGVHYLAEGRAHAEFVRFARGLAFSGASGETVRIPGVGAYQDRLEGELLALYRPPASEELHATFIGLSALLKLSRELSDSGADAAALDRALAVRRGMRALAQTEPGQEDLARLEHLLSEERNRIAALDGDATVATAYLQAAESALVAASVDGDADALADLEALATRVLPDALACLAVESEEARPDARAIDVTLVRWPYT